MNGDPGLPAKRAKMIGGPRAGRLMLVHVRMGVLHLPIAKPTAATPAAQHVTPEPIEYHEYVILGRAAGGNYEIFLYNGKVKR